MRKREICGLEDRQADQKNQIIFCIGEIKKGREKEGMRLKDEKRAREI